MSAARPLPVPPVSKRRPGGRTTSPACSSTANRRHGCEGSGRAGRRGGASASASASGSPAIPARERGSPARLDLTDQGRVDEAAGALGGRRGRRRPRGAAAPRRGPVGGGSALRAQSSLSGRKRERAASNALRTRVPRSAASAAGGMPGPGSPISSRTWLPIASKVRSCSAIVRKRSSVTGSVARGGSAARSVVVGPRGHRPTAGGGDDGGDDPPLDHLAHQLRRRALRGSGAAEL